MKTHMACVIADVLERLADLSVLTGGDIRVVGVGDQGRTERAPGVIYTAGTAHIDEHKRAAVKHTTFAQQASHRRVIRSGRP